MRVQLLLVFLALASVSPPSAQTRLIGTGDILAGGETAGGVATGTAQNTSGSWATHAGVNGLNALVRDGAVYAMEGDSIGTLPGAVFGAGLFGLDLNEAGDMAYVIPIEEPGKPSTLGLFLGPNLLVRSGDLVPVAGLPAGSTYAALSALDLNDSGQLLMRGTWEVPGSIEINDAMFLFDIAADGTLAGTSIFAQEGDLIPGTTDTVSLLGIGGQMSLNDAGDVLWYAEGGFSSTGYVIKNSTVLATDGTPTPVPGLVWQSTPGGRPMAMNNAGETAWSWAVSPAPDTHLLVENGSKVVLTGDVLPDLEGVVAFAVHNYLSYADDGTVVWFGSSSTVGGLFVNDRLLIESPSVLDGKLFHLTLSPAVAVHPFSVSPDGESVDLPFFSFSDIESAIYRFDIGQSATPMLGCAGNPGTLQLTAGTLGSDDTFTLSMDGGQALGVGTYLAFSTKPAPGWPACGPVLPGLGELLIDFAEPNPVFVLGGVPWSGAPKDFTIPVPLDMFMVTAYAQGMFVGLGGIAPGEPFRLTNGLELYFAL